MKKKTLKEVGMRIQARKDNLLVQNLDEEVVVYDQDTDQVHRLNGAAAVVWRSCDGKTTVADMAATLASETELPEDETIIHHALKQFDKAGLLLEGVPALHDIERISRRRLIAKLSVGAGIAVLLPLVSSMVAPSPVYAQSTTTTTTTTT